MAALQNLVKIMSLYYQYMETYMGPALFAVRNRKCCSFFKQEAMKTGLGPASEPDRIRNRASVQADNSRFMCSCHWLTTDPCW